MQLFHGDQLLLDFLLRHSVGIPLDPGIHILLRKVIVVHACQTKIGLGPPNNTLNETWTFREKEGVETGRPTDLNTSPLPRETERTRR